MVGTVRQRCPLLLAALRVDLVHQHDSLGLSDGGGANLKIKTVVQLIRRVHGKRVYDALPPGPVVLEREGDLPKHGTCARPGVGGTYGTHALP